MAGTDSRQKRILATQTRPHQRKEMGQPGTTSDPRSGGEIEPCDREGRPIYRRTLVRLGNSRFYFLPVDRTVSIAAHNPQLQSPQTHLSSTCAYNPCHQRIRRWRRHISNSGGRANIREKLSTPVFQKNLS
jgi:hypothetical protein